MQNTTCGWCCVNIVGLIANTQNGTKAKKKKIDFYFLTQNKMWIRYSVRLACTVSTHSWTCYLRLKFKIFRSCVVEDELTLEGDCIFVPCVTFFLICSFMPFLFWTLPNFEVVDYFVQWQRDAGEESVLI